MPYFDQNEPRKRAFRELIQQAQGPGMRNQLARFVGHGSPMARVLFVGQELAISPQHNVHFQDEIGNNLPAWQRFLKLKGNGDDWTTQLDGASGFSMGKDRAPRSGSNVHATLAQEFHFSPIFPAAYFPQPQSPRHTWGRYSRILFGHDVDTELALGIRKLEGAFSHKCFLTEWSPIPAKNARVRGQALQIVLQMLQINGEVQRDETPETLLDNLQASRRQFLSSNFFRTFRLTIVCNARALPAGRYHVGGQYHAAGPDHKAVIGALGFDGVEWNLETVSNARIAHAIHEHRQTVITCNATAWDMMTPFVLNHLHKHFTVPALV